MKAKKILVAAFAAAVSFSMFRIPSGSSALVSEDSFLFRNIVSADKLSLGDVNGDGAVDATDASDVLKEYSLVSTGKDSAFSAEQKKAGDIDGNGANDSTDASAILAYYSYFSTGGTLSFEEYLKRENVTPSSTTTKPAATTTKSAATTTKTTAKSTATTTKAPATTTKSAAATTKTTAKPTTSASKPATTSAKVTTTTAAVTTVPVSTADPDRVSGIKLTRTEMTVNVNEGDLAAYVTMLPATAKNKAEIWSSDNEAIAIVDEEGWVTGISEGECIITVTSVDNPAVKAEIKVTVKDIYTVREIRLSRYSMSIEAGTGALSANVTMFPTTAYDKREIWSSSDESIAVTDSEGWVIAKAPGTCIITVQSMSNPDVKAEIEVTVYASGSTQTTTDTPTSSETTTTTTTTTEPGDPKRVSEIHLSLTEINLSVGEKGISYVTMLPATAENKNEIWKSSDESVAVVDGIGTITALREGVCTITVISEDNPDVSADITVTVTNPNRVTEIVLTKYELTIPLGTVDISYVTMYPETAPNKNEIWVCSDETIASVDENGWIYGRRLGECIVTVYSQDNPEVKAEIHVTIVEPEAVEPGDDELYSYIDKEHSDENKLAFVTVLPEEGFGRFIIDYVITDSEGNVTTITSPTLLVPEMGSVLTYLSAETNEFSVTSYITNLGSSARARIGTYHFDLRNAAVEIEIEDIRYAFSYIGGLND